MGEGREAQAGGLCTHTAETLHGAAETGCKAIILQFEEKVKSTRHFTETLGIPLCEGAMFECSDSSRRLTASTMKLCWGLDRR